MAQLKPDRNLRLLLFQDQTCTMRPLFALLPIRLEQKQTKVTKSEIASSLMQHRDKAHKIKMSARMACAPRP